MFAVGDSTVWKGDSVKDTVSVPIKISEEEIAERVAEMLFSSMHDQVESMAREIVTKKLTALVDSKGGAIIDAMLDGEIHETNSYGEVLRSKPAKPLREFIADRALAWMMEKVDSRGERYGCSDSATSRISWIVAKRVEEVLR
jgi:uncharacterized membrane-anchored protein YjiN (DUF445 family)